MRRSLIASPVVLLMMSATLLWPVSIATLAADNSSADGGKTGNSMTIAVVDFDYSDTSGEERDQRREHEARLKEFMAALRGHLAVRGNTIVSLNCNPAPCPAARAPDDLLRAAREAGAGVLLIGSIHKMSTLVQWAKAGAIDTATERVMFDKLFTFRGDNDESWRRAESFIAGEIAALQQTGGK
jgi:hypothetical protein